MPVSKLVVEKQMSCSLSTVQRGSMIIPHQQKIEMLRHYELIGYRIAYYLLDNEQLAQQAVALAMHDLYSNDHFFITAAAERDKLMQKYCQRHAILLHSISL